VSHRLGGRVSYGYAVRDSGWCVWHNGDCCRRGSGSSPCGDVQLELVLLLLVAILVLLIVLVVLAHLVLVTVQHARRGIFARFEGVPVEDVIIREALSVEQIPDELPQISVVRLLLESQRTDVILVGGKLGWCSLGELLNRRGQLLLTDLLVLLSLVLGPQTLPWKCSLRK